MLTSFKFREVTFQIHDPQGKLKEHLQQVSFIWSYSHEDLLPSKLSQQQVLVKSQIPTLDQMTQIDKEAKFISPKRRKEKFLLSGEISYGSRMKKKNHHLHHCPCTTLIRTKKIQICHLIDPQLLLYMMLHFLGIWKKFIVHLSWRKFHLKGIW